MAHVGIFPICERNKCFFDVLWRSPSEQILRCASFVVCARKSGTAEWLLTNNGTSTLIIDIKISRRVF